MSVIAECLIAPSAHPLGPAIEVPEGITVEFERFVPTGGERLPYLWVRGETYEDFVGSLEAAAGIESVEVCDRFEDEALVRIGWDDEPPALPRRIAEEGVTLLGITGREDGWVFRIRSPDRDRVERLHDFCLDMGMQFELMRIYVLSEAENGPPHDLTTEQYEALVTAYREGYFSEPRETTLEDLGESFGITARAVSRRLRRGTATLVRTALGVDRDGE
jgi:predicted DNA binding protein